MTEKITTHIENLNSKIDDVVLEYFSSVVNKPHSDGKLNLKKIIGDFNSMYVSLDSSTDSINDTSSIVEIDLKKELAQLSEDFGVEFDSAYKNTTYGLYDELSTYKSNKCLFGTEISLIKNNICKDVLYIHILKKCEKSKCGITSYTHDINTIRVSFKELTLETLDKTSKDYVLMYFGNPWALINSVIDALDSGYKIRSI